MWLAKSIFMTHHMVVFVLLLVEESCQKHFLDRKRNGKSDDLCNGEFLLQMAASSVMFTDINWTLPMFPEVAEKERSY